ncbi:MAG: hypothetical protein ACLP2Y_17280 [Limisphaerales bacterium]
MKKIYVLIHRKCRHRHQVEEALGTVRNLQSHFRFVIQKPEWLHQRAKEGAAPECWL